MILRTVLVLSGVLDPAFTPRRIVDAFRARDPRRDDDTAPVLEAGGPVTADDGVSLLARRIIDAF